MNFPEKASAQFPKATWLGQSDIHVSFACGGIIPVSFYEPRKIMSLLSRQNLAQSIRKTIVGNCPDMEWLMSPEDFQSLLLVDFYRLLHSQPTLPTKKRLRNPVTKNLFHRITLIESASMVGGVRVWLESDEMGSCRIGWRFRLEEQVSEAVNIREKASELAESLVPEMELITEYISKEKTEPIQIMEKIVFH